MDRTPNRGLWSLNGRWGSALCIAEACRWAAQRGGGRWQSRSRGYQRPWWPSTSPPPVAHRLHAVDNLVAEMRTLSRQLVRSSDWPLCDGGKGRVSYPLCARALVQGRPYRLMVTIAYSPIAEYRALRAMMESRTLEDEALGRVRQELDEDQWAEAQRLANEIPHRVQSLGLAAIRMAWTRGAGLAPWPGSEAAEDVFGEQVLQLALLSAISQKITPQSISALFDCLVFRK